MALDVGDRSGVLDSADVLTHSIVRDLAENYRDCNVGHDVLDAFPTCIITFRYMAFLLR